MRQPADALRIGVLNLMHDKLDTRARFLRSEEHTSELQSR